MNSKFFTSKYPIVEASMYGGSDLPLAIACWDAGIFPSIYVHSMIKDDTYTDKVNDTLKEFIATTGSGNIVFGIEFDDLFNTSLVKVLKSHKVSHLEVLPILRGNTRDNSEAEWLEKNYGRRNVMDAVMKILAPIKIMRRKTMFTSSSDNYWNPFGQYAKNNPMDYAYCVKGSDSAGWTGESTTAEMFATQKHLTPDAIVIPYGGVGTPEQVASYINNGATAVAVGTLLAASKESTLSVETKLAMISSKKDSITKLGDTGQNSLILGNKESVIQDRETSGWNRSKSLNIGLRGDGKSGHIYVGSAIDHITEIKSVKEIVEYLVSLLP